MVGPLEYQGLPGSELGHSETPCYILARQLKHLYSVVPPRRKSLMSSSPSVCAGSLPSAALFVTMVGHKRRVRLKGEGLPCALMVKILRSKQAAVQVTEAERRLNRGAEQMQTTTTNVDNSSVTLLTTIQEEDRNGLIRDLVNF